MKKGTEISRLEVRCLYLYKGTEWLLAYAPECEQFAAINYKYLERVDSGSLTLTQPLNGVQMHLSPDMSSLMKSVNDEVDFDELIAAGLTRAQALCKLAGVEYMPELEDLLS